MKRITALLSFYFISMLCVHANNGRYRLIITDNPATTITIGWEQSSGTNPVVYYGTSDFGENVIDYPNSKTVDRTVNDKGMNNAFAKLIGLTPNTAYYFVIQDSEGVSNRFWFKTAPATNETMSFIAGGDSRNNRTPRQNANTLVAKIKPTAVFFGGDMTNGDSDGEWQDWMDDWQLTTSSDGRMIPIIPARGNHEYSNDRIYNLFNIPNAEGYYKTIFGENLYSVYTLNSEIAAGGDQYNWLATELNTDNSIWKSAQYHKPMRPINGSKSEGDDEYSNWSQLFYEKEVNLVYESDSHSVKSTWPIKPCSGGANCEEGFERDDLKGTVYVGEGCWGAPLRSNNDAKTWTRDSGSFNQFKYVTVSPFKIELQTIVVDNASEVGENPNDAVGVLPANVELWNPSNGSMVELFKRYAPEIAITSVTDGSYFDSEEYLNILTDATDVDGDISKVEFIINGSLVETVTEAPFELSQLYTSGAYNVEVLAYDNDGLTATDQVVFWVGSFNAQSNITASVDVEERLDNGTVDASSSALEMARHEDGWWIFTETFNHATGLSFNNIAIPSGATITNAYVQFTASADNNAATTLEVTVEDAVNSENYTSVNNNVTNRTYTNSVSWSPAAWINGDVNEAQQTPNLSSLIQNIIDKEGWDYNNAINIKVEGSGVSLTDLNARRIASTIEGGAAAVLHIEYSFISGVLNIDKSEIKNIKLYPNPVSDILYLKLPTSTATYTAEVYNLNGKRVYSESIKNSQLQVGHLNSGIYFVKVLNSTNGQSIVKKISIK